MSTLNALVLNCTLKPAPTASSSEVLGTELLEALKEHDVTGGDRARRRRAGALRWSRSTTATATAPPRVVTSGRMAA